MYNTKVNCTYNTSDVFLETDKISDQEKEVIRDALYRQELLNILGMEEFNEDEMNKAIHELHEQISSCQELIECILKLSGRFMSTDEELGLMILFAYDYMYLTHACISEYLETEQISEKNIRNLRAIIF
jgi:hypothetical protein|uniref:Uncharacterized protein n=1 Tax=viral metagenome TaxID=1070528 RepID=A0A6C0AR80_9ZZZZ